MSLRLALLPGLAAAFACATPQKTAFQLALPGTQLDMTVSRLVPRGPYLEVWLRAPGLDLVSWAPASELCRGVLAEEGRIAYRSGGTGGSFERAGRRCEAAGIGSLEEWRARRPQPRTRSPVPSAPASFQVIHRDEEIALARGRFPLAGLLGWVGSADTVAAIPNTPICQKPLESGAGTLQYFPAGREVLALASEGGLCPITGLLVPLAGPGS
jgi:hypothetical protein